MCVCVCLKLYPCSPGSNGSGYQPAGSRFTFINDFISFSIWNAFPGRVQSRFYWPGKVYVLLKHRLFCLVIQEVFNIQGETLPPTIQAWTQRVAADKSSHFPPTVKWHEHRKSQTFGVKQQVMQSVSFPGAWRRFRREIRPWMLQIKLFSVLLWENLVLISYCGFKFLFSGY